MAIRIYNTLTKKKEVFRSKRGKKVSMFVCGPTTYDYAHMGNAKTYTQFDIIANYLRQRGLKVTYIQNITDIDDKIIKKAKKSNKDPLALSHYFYRAYKEDMEKLGNRAVSKYVKATERMKEIISQVKRLEEKGFTYTTPEGVYFNLEKDREYGKLSGRTRLQAEDATSRIDESREKRNKGDFCLWKFAKEGEVSWPSPFGKGRPGWHIEDTAITEKEFGQQYDIHGGAVDLIFPHHEAEIAQMESLSGKKPFVRYWMHAGFLDMKREKMSKSKGNIITVREIMNNYPPKVVRFFFASSHYRSRINFSEDVLDQARNGLERMNDCIQSLNNEDDIAMVREVRKKFYEAMDDDINTPKAFAAIFEFITERNKKGHGGKKTLAFFKEVDEIFGVFSWKESIPSYVKKLAEQRERARKEKRWREADEMRRKIETGGYTIEDSEEGFKVKKR